MRNRIPVLFAAALLSGVAAAPTPARAQIPPVDSRWLAYLGCWQSLEVGRGSTVCLVPASSTAAVDLVTIDSGRVVAAEQIDANGQRIETMRAECTGWQTAEWSEVGDRLYLRSAETCPNGGTRTGTGLIALSREGHLLYIQGNAVLAKTGVRVQRFREASVGVELPSEVVDALRVLDGDLTAEARARAAAAAPLEIDDLAEASRALDVEVIEAWLVERGGTFQLDAQRLLALEQAGVPARITDLMIALSNPKAFSMRLEEPRRASPRSDNVDVTYSGSTPYGYGGCMRAYQWYPFASFDCGALGSWYLYMYGWYPRDYPVSIVYTGGVISGGGSSGRSHGRVVNGRGYEAGESITGDVGRTGQPRSNPPPVATPAPSASASSGEQRTAKPRP